ncbi:hypothetical protein FB45DRAFT_941793 [Roridomyces roridus]|uniref:Uncharacterized protein n=1 Tax=Roridomyces roridus TaxID=1738132 RepID=A0AAD7FBQ9_9AGAR|nr:hypothetical protein FB45DRAFT_941793 [Roridomyces roridus]
MSQEAVDAYASIGIPNATFEDDIENVALEVAPEHRELLKQALRSACEKLVVYGNKPTPGLPQDEVYILDLHDNSTGARSIRLFPGGTQPEQKMFFFDFLNQIGAPVNLPQGCTVYQGINNEEVELQSVEAGYNVQPDDLGPGLEKFAISEGAHCIFKSPGATRHFKIPLRKRDMRSPFLMDEFTRMVAGY